MIEVKGLTKKFDELVAVNDLSFSVAAGEILGFLGPNGAGKSTSMKMLTGFLEPTSGTASIGGADIIKDSLAARKQVGYLPESAPFYGEMTVYEYLDFISDIRQLKGTAKTAALDRIAATCFLEDVWYQAIETLSKGYRQRVGVAQALIHDPPVLILDEPTDGLDPNQKHEVRNLIRSLASQKTIVLSTHILEEVEHMCSRIIIVAKGRLIIDSKPEELRRRSLHHGAITLSLGQGFTGKPSESFSKIPEVERVVPVIGTPHTWRIYPKPGQSVTTGVLKVLEEKRWTVQQLFVEQGRLDDVFRELTGERKLQNESVLASV